MTPRRCRTLGSRPRWALSQHTSLGALFTLSCHHLLELLPAHLAIPVVVKFGKNCIDLSISHLLRNLKFCFKSDWADAMVILRHLSKLCPGDEAISILVKQLESCVRRTHSVHHVCKRMRCYKIYSNTSNNRNSPKSGLHRWCTNNLASRLIHFFR